MANWQKRLRLAVALFVVVFAALVVVSLRRGHKPPPEKLLAPKKLDSAKEVAFQSAGGGEHASTKEGKVVFKVKFGNQVTYTDGSSKLGGGVTVWTTKNGREITIE